ncbi:hypothetical protein F4805DRAFT_463506 [Annulohypoxylon moriforme]|nr:hypothetical protein F4805DRAFT_463506 [Annulohypoxylon moriforme]
MADIFDLDNISKLPPEVLENTPLMAAPAGFTTNFVNPPSQAPSILIITEVTVPLIFIFLGLRIYIRVRINRDFSKDDHLCVLSAFLSITYTGLTLAMLNTPGNGPAGPHMWDVPLIRITKSYLEESLATASLFSIASITVKTSILAFFLRLFRPYRAARIMSWVGIVITVLFYTAWMIPTWPLCIPNFSTSTTCTQFIGHMSNAYGIFSSISDFYILFIPMYMIQHLKLPTHHKYSIAGVFLTGLCACVVSIAGTIYRFEFYRSEDKTWMTVPVYATVILELNIGIVCSCMPIVFVLFKRGTRKVRNHCSGGFRTLAAKGRGKFDGKNHVLEDINFPNKPRAAIIGVRTVVHQVHYQNMSDGGRWANTWYVSKHGVSKFKEFHFELPTFNKS